ncbi:hypothetical protein [Echinicola vietnamensis]|uniref:Uncharacterized protein n=1 Tax=Echinicola vietnamensis (strain DSM 17526 / LMG 23754 / KMM 6221) TaxID=926556 RepID=L0FYC6_ECHVK|nr:hypothetical protein [Echinicola vietnamensis]AGA77640.1 hypothetical protein Echvi_1371 [Echinicola vietnamensis DSM 17526]
MKTNFFIFLGSIAILFSTACNKDKKALPTTVEGYVYNGVEGFTWNKPIEVILVKEVASGSWISGTGEEIVATTYADSNGYYRVDFKAENTRHWVRICASGIPLHHNYCNSVGGPPVERGTKQKIDLYLPPYSWLQLHVENVNYQPFDVLSLSWGNGISRSFYGPANDTALLLGAGLKRTLIFALKRNNVWSNIYDTAYLTPFDTTYHKLKY